MSKLLKLPEAKEFIRLPNAQADPHLQLLLDAAESWIAEEIGTAFQVTSRVDTLPGGFPTLRPTLLPIVAISEVRDVYTDEVVAAADFRWADGKVFWASASGGGYPVMWNVGPARYRVTYTAGYNDGDTNKPEGSVAAPVGIKLPLLHLVERAYKARGGVQIQTSSGAFTNWEALANGEIRQLLQPYILKSMVR